MSRFNDPRHLESELARAHMGGFVIDKDRTCRHCQYDLTGLRYGANCPECGKVIRFGSAMVIPVRDRLQDTQTWYIRLVQAAFGAMIPGSLGIILIALDVSGVGLAAVGVAALPLALFWLAGVAVVCSPKPGTETVKRTAQDDLAWRAAAGATQIMWLVAAVLSASGAWGPAIFGLALSDIVAWAAVAGALVGLGALAWVVAGFHEWMQDDDGAGRMRRRTCWLIMLAAVMLLGGSFRVPLGVPVLSLLVGGVDLLPIIAGALALLLIWSFVGLTRMAGWSVVAKRTDAARTDRLRRQRASETAAEQERLRNAPIEPPTTYHKAPTPNRQTGHGGPDRVAGSEWRR